VAALKNRAIVELRIGWETVLAPVPEKRLAGVGGAHAECRPSRGRSLPLRAQGQNLKKRATLKPQIFHHIAAI
jgi:hypothetical protein